MSISVCIITKNEAENIAACIRSVAWADEIIVVDNFSEDNTPQIAESLGAKVYIEDWKGFGAQKNSAIHKASGDWILSLDADERVTDSLRIEIQQRLDLKNSVSGYYIPRKNYFCGKWIRYGGWYPDYSLRLFRKISGRFENRSVHEKVIISGKTDYLKNPMHHYTYKSIGDFLIRMEKYSRLSLDEIRKKNKKFSITSITLRPLFTFFAMYILRLGFLDGKEGFFLAVSYSYYTFLKYYRFWAESTEQGSYKGSPHGIAEGDNDAV